MRCGAGAPAVGQDEDCGEADPAQLQSALQTTQSLYRANELAKADVISKLAKSEAATAKLEDEKRAEEAYKQGARFAKWRNVLQIDPANMKTYLRWLADNWPDDFEDLNARASAAAEAA